VNQNILVRFAYEVARNPKRRSEFLATFAEIIDASSAAIAVEDHHLRKAILPDAHGLDPSSIDSYCSFYVGLNPWAGRRPSTVGEVRTSDELLSEKELRETEFYHGWMKPHGCLHATSIIVQTTATYRAYVFAMRPHPFTEKELAILENVAPDFAEAAQIGKDIADLRDTIDRLRKDAREFDILRGRGLKPSDCHIALALFQGQSVKEIAHKSNRGHEAVRWHVKAIYRTLGVHDRAEFMRLLHDLFRQ
jgi:Bacterial regulatory proteins, luxR family